MIALIDTNVVLDVFFAREPHVFNSSAVLAAVERGQCQGLLCATTLTTIHYIVERQMGTAKSLDRIKLLLSMFGVAAVNESVIHSAVNRDMTDFEDAVLYESALQAGANCIVTRNTIDFSSTEIPIYTPDQLIAVLGIND